jgi:hypothetical protein
MGKGLFLGGLNGGLGKPCLDRLKIGDLHPIEIGAPDAEEALSVIDDRGEFVAIRDKDTAPDMGAVSQSHEGGELPPCHRLTARSEFHLIGTQISEQRLKHAIDSVIHPAQSQLSEHIKRRGVQWPDLMRIMFPLGSEVRLGKDFKGIALPLVLGNRGNRFSNSSNEESPANSPFFANSLALG